MKTAVRPETETVKFGTVTQCGRHWAFVRTDTGAEVRLYWSRLRLVEVESVNGGLVFSTGKGSQVRKGDAVVFVPQKEGLWLWTLRADYETVRDFVERNPISPPSPPAPAEPVLLTAPLPPSPPAPEIELDAEMEVMYGRRQLDKFRRRYPQREPRAFM